MGLHIWYCKSVCLDGLRVCKCQRDSYKRILRIVTSAVQTGPATGMLVCLRALTLLPKRLHQLDAPERPLELSVRRCGMQSFDCGKQDEKPKFAAHGTLKRRRGCSYKRCLFCELSVECSCQSSIKDWSCPVKAMCLRWSTRGAVQCAKLSATAACLQ